MDTSLDHDHTRKAVAARLGTRAAPSLLGDALLGAMDGSVTTFTLVAGGFGAGFAPHVALVLGLSKLASDGLSMAVGNYERARSELHLREQARRMEERHIDLVPEGEREEVRQLFARKGIEGRLLEEVVERITSDRERWIETMLVEEHGFALRSRSPSAVATTTFLAFVAVGAIPLVPLVLGLSLGPGGVFTPSAVATGIAFLGIGVVRGAILGRSRLISGLQTLLLGSAAALAAWAVARIVA